MNVYLEYVILDNLIIDGLILRAVSATLRINTKWWRILLGALIGTACAAVSVYIEGVWLYVIKIICVAAMCIVTVGIGKKLFWHILLTVAYTFIFGGAVIGIFNLLNIDYLNGGGMFYQLGVPFSVYVAAAALTAFLCYSVYTYCRQLKKIAPFLIKCAVTIDNRKYSVVGFCDSGNTLRYGDIPVCFVTKSFGKFLRYFAEQTVAGRTAQIEVNTVGGISKVNAVIAILTVKDKSRTVYLALPKKRCNANYNLILNNDFCL